MMKISRRVRRVVVMSVAFVAGLWLADVMLSARSAADIAGASTAPATPSTQATISAEAQAVLARSAAAYAKLPLTVEATLETDFDVAGMTDQRKLRITGTALSTTRFVHEVEGEVKVVADGEAFHVLDVKKNVYLSNKPTNDRSEDPAEATATPVPEKESGKESGKEAVRVVVTPADASGNVSDKTPGVGVLSVTSDPLVAAMLREQNPAMFLALAPGASLFVDGETVALEADPTRPESDVIVVTADQIRRKMFVNKSDGTISRIETDFKAMLEKQGAREIKRAGSTLAYLKTDFKSPPDVALFAFKPPADATEAKDTSREMLTSAGDAEGLKGKPAPAFELSDLAGQKLSLASLKGKVVVLDFWATWCGPCVASLPGLDALAKEFAEKDVVVLALNQQEDVDTVRTFLESKKLTIKTLLDAEGSAGKAYRVTGIPQTVVIGRDGVVQKVYVGAGPRHDQKIKSDIEAALK